jgi:hypothetical protein
MNIFNPIEAVIPKAREARARFLQRASRAEESAPLQFGRGMRMVSTSTGLLRFVCGATLLHPHVIPQHTVNVVVGIFRLGNDYFAPFSCYKQRRMLLQANFS